MKEKYRNTLAKLHKVLQEIDDHPGAPALKSALDALDELAVENEFLRQKVNRGLGRDSQWVHEFYEERSPSTDDKSIIYQAEWETGEEFTISMLSEAAPICARAEDIRLLYRVGDSVMVILADTGRRSEATEDLVPIMNDLAERLAGAKRENEKLSKTVETLSETARKRRDKIAALQLEIRNYEKAAKMLD